MEDIGVRLSEVRSDTHNLIERFGREDTERKGAVGEMVGEFKRTDDERKAAVGEMVGEFKRDDDERKAAVNELRRNTKDMVGDFRKANSELKATADEMVEGFHRDSSERKAAVGEMVGEFKRTDDERKAAVGEMVGEFSSDRGQAHQIWTQRLKEKIKPRAVVRKVKEKPSVEAAPPPNEKKILEVITGHPDGIRLIDIGNELGVDWRVLIGPSKSLMDEGRVEKIENMYYPKKEG